MEDGKERKIIFTIASTPFIIYPQLFVFDCHRDEKQERKSLTHASSNRPTSIHLLHIRVHNFSANIFVFMFSFRRRKLSQIIISNFDGLWCFHRSTSAMLIASIVQLYSHFNDHYCGVCYDAARDAFSGLCNQNSMVYNAWIVMRLFYHLHSSFSGSSRTSSARRRKEKHSRIQNFNSVLLLFGVFTYAPKDEAHYLNNRPLSPNWRNNDLHKARAERRRRRDQKEDKISGMARIASMLVEKSALRCLAFCTIIDVYSGCVSSDQIYEKLKS